MTTNKTVNPKKRINRKSGITLIELVIAILVITTVTTASVMAITSYIHISYINGEREKLDSVLTDVCDLINNDYKNNGIKDRDYYQQLAKNLINSSHVMVKKDGLSEGPEIEVKTSFLYSNGVYEGRYCSIEVLISNGKTGKYAVSLKETIILPDKAK